MTKNCLMPACLFACLFVLAGCSKYGYVNVKYTLDPEMSLPENIKTIALVNRSSGGDKEKNILESIATAEIAGSDRLASDECLLAVFDNGNGQGMTFVTPQKSKLPRTGTRTTPELLDWKLVRKICDSTHAEALLALETFDSNSDLLINTALNTIGTVLNGGKPTADLPEQVQVDIMIFWRLYDPATKKIIDQYQSKRYITLNHVGPQYTLAAPDALRNAAYAAGSEYIGRFLSSYYNVKRDMYKTAKGKSKEKFEAAFRRTEVANWDEAIIDWTAIANSTDSKAAGKACLDIAVSYEVLGDNDKALQWAKKSYEDYGDKLGKEYVKVLLR